LCILQVSTDAIAVNDRGETMSLSYLNPATEPFEAAVRYARLWPRALDLNRPTAADAHALTLLAREQERIPAARVDFHLAAAGSASKPGSPPADNDPE